MYLLFVRLSIIVSRTQEKCPLSCSSHMYALIGATLVAVQSVVAKGRVVKSWRYRSGGPVRAQIWNLNAS